MKNLQKMGGIAALYQAAAYLAGLVFFVLVVGDSGVVEPAQKVASLVDNQFSMYIMTLLIYVVFGGFLAVLALAVYDRLKTGAPATMQVATAFGLIWAGLLIASGMVFNIGMGTVVDLYGKDPTQAATVWLAIESVSSGLGGELEIVGGLWALLVSWAALRAGGLPRPLNYLGVVIGVAGLLTVVPALYTVVLMVFALGQIVWFVWLGIVMLRSRPSTAPVSA